MSGGILGVAGDILSVAFLCFLCSLAIQLYCAFSRRATSRLPSTPLPATIRSPPPQLPASASQQLYLLRFQRSASSPVVSAIAPPPSPPNKLSSAYHVTCSLAGSPPSYVGPLPCAVASHAHTADLAKLMQLESRAQELQEVDVESFMSVPPPRGLLFTIKEEVKDEDATEQQSSVASDTSGEGGSMESMADQLASQAGTTLNCPESFAHGAPANFALAQVAPAAPGLVSQVSSSSSEGGVSLWSTTSPCPSSPAVSYLSASSSPFPSSSPPRSSFWAQTSRFSAASN